MKLSCKELKDLLFGAELDGTNWGKCNKYFFNLEKRSYEKRHKTKLKTPEGITAEDPKVILTVMKNFYNQLYTSQNQPSAERFSNFSDYESLPKLDNEKQNLCEGPITVEECLVALKTFQHNKTPGTVGLTAEFYLCFWNDISGPLIGCLNHGALGELSIFQRQGIISLIPKKKKDPLLLKNWSPISLLNTDYKLATKCIATRLEKVLPHLIESDQTGYIKGRFIGENIRLISDIIEQHENKEGMILVLVGLATKIPKNGLKIFPEFLEKCSKKPIKTPKNLQKSYDI